MLAATRELEDVTGAIGTADGGGVQFLHHLFAPRSPRPVLSVPRTQFAPYFVPLGPPTNCLWQPVLLASAPQYSKIGGPFAAGGTPARPATSALTRSAIRALRNIT